MNLLKEDTRKTSFPLEWEELIRHPMQKVPEEGSFAWKYWEISSLIYNKFCAALTSESIKDYRFFVDTFEKLHELMIGDGNTKEPKLRANVCCNAYPNESIYAYQIAKSLFDPHFKHRHRRCYPTLLNIPFKDLPSNEEQRHYYPFPKSFPIYLKNAHLKCLEVLKPNKSTVEKLLDISLFYQYLINARPFYKKNNSYFMVLVNALIHHLGLKGISHYLLDHLAHRLHYRNFSTLFVSAVYEKNPSLASFNLKNYMPLIREFHKHSLKLLSFKKSMLNKKLETLCETFKGNHKNNLETKTLIDLFASSILKTLSQGEDYFIYAPQHTILNEVHTDREDNMVIFCAQWYDAVYPWRKVFSNQFPTELPRASD